MMYLIGFLCILSLLLFLSTTSIEAFNAVVSMIISVLFIISFGDAYGDK